MQMAVKIIIVIRVVRTLRLKDIMTENHGVGSSILPLGTNIPKPLAAPPCFREAVCGSFAGPA